MATFIIGVVLVIIVIVILLLLLLLGKRIRVGDLSEIRQLSLLGSNYSLLGQLIELLGENILYLGISKCSPHRWRDCFRTYLDDKRILVGLRHWAIVGLRIMRDLIAEDATTVSTLRQMGRSV